MTAADSDALERNVEHAAQRGNYVNAVDRTYSHAPPPASFLFGVRLGWRGPVPLRLRKPGVAGSVPALLSAQPVQRSGRQVLSPSTPSYAKLGQGLRAEFFGLLYYCFLRWCPSQYRFERLSCLRFSALQVHPPASRAPQDPTMTSQVRTHHHGASLR